MLLCDLGGVKYQPFLNINCDKHSNREQINYRFFVEALSLIVNYSLTLSRLNKQT